MGSSDKLSFNDTDYNNLIESCSSDGIIEINKLKHGLKMLTDNNSNGFTLESFITSLGSFLVSTILEDRIKGLKLLCAYIESQSHDKFNDNQVDFLTEFLVSRLKDHHSFIPIVINSLLFLSREFHISEAQSFNVFNTISKSIHVQTLRISERFKIYQLIGILLNSHLTAFQVKSKDFLYGFIQISEGERDPRCLLLTYQLFAHIASNFSLGVLVEEIFDIVACYFPIDYKPVNDKQAQISRQELHLLLKKCFLSNSSFAPYALPLLLEKLESDIDNSKIDAYDILNDSCDIYGLENLKSFLPSFWTCIRIDSLQISNFQIKDAALKTLKSIMILIQDDNISNIMLSTIFKDLEIYLVNLSLELVIPCINIFAAICSCSQYYFEKICKQIFKLMIQNMAILQRKEKLMMVDGLSELFNKLSKLKFDKKFPYQESILTLLFSYFNENDHELNLASVKCITYMISHSFPFTNEEISAIALAIVSILRSFRTKEISLIEETNELLKIFATKYNDITQEKIVKELFYLDPQFNDIDSIKNSLEALKLCKLDKTYIKKWISFIQDILYNQNISTSLKEFVISANYLIIIPENINDFYECFLNPILEKLEKISLPLPPLNVDEHIFYIIKCIIINTSQDHIKKILSIFNKFLHKIVQIYKIENISNYLAFIRHVMSFASFEICSLQNSTIFKDLLNLYKNECIKNERKMILEMIEIIVNRSNDNLMELELIELISSNENNVKMDTIKLFLSINRALVVRSYNNMPFTNILLQLLNEDCEEEIIKVIANNFVPNHNDYIYLLSENNANVSLFYRQIYYYQTNNELFKGYTQNEENSLRKKCFALCLLYHLKNLPKEMIKVEIKRFHSIIVMNLAYDFLDENHLISLDCVTILIENNSLMLKQNLNTVIKSLIFLAQKNVQLIIRKKSLECLGLIAKHLDTIDLLPLRSLVIKELKSSLDDKKRLVRYSASCAIHRWIIIGQPM